MKRKIELVVIGAGKAYGVMVYVPKDKVFQMLKIFDNFLDAVNYLDRIEAGKPLRKR